MSSLLALFTALTQAVSMMIALSVYLGIIDEHLGWAYAFGWIGFVFHVFATVAFGVQVFMVRRLARHTYTPVNPAAT